MTSRGLGRDRLRATLERLLAFADEPGDNDDTRLRKRVSVGAAYVLAFAAVQLPVLAQGHPISWVVAFGMPIVNAANLFVLWRTRRFDRYVMVLVAVVLAFAVLVEVSLGGLNGSSAAILFGFLGPVFAFLALGPTRATAWFIVFLGSVVGVVLLDPAISSRVAPQPYPMRLVWYLANLVVPLGITFAMLRYTDLRRRAAEERSEELLTNAIPHTIAARLKRGERRIAEAFPQTTVVFADLVGFTPWTRATDPRRVVDVLDELFSTFDGLAAASGVEKIKTIGDSYMAVAGAPDPRADHAAAAMAFAQDLLVAMAEARARLEVPLELRVGLASGPVVGGVIGHRRLLFDLWGDTVNLASRLEAAGVTGRIHLADSTRVLLPDGWTFEERASIDVRGLGPMTTYLLAEAPAVSRAARSGAVRQPSGGRAPGASAR
jgi:adenylate cyclase